MKLSYIDVLGDGQRHQVEAQVTADHPDSSYGQPVIVLASDNKALDIASWILMQYQIVSATPDEFELLKRVLILDPMFAEHPRVSQAAAALGSRTSKRKAK